MGVKSVDPLISDFGPGDVPGSPETLSGQDLERDFTCSLFMRDQHDHTHEHKHCHREMEAEEGERVRTSRVKELEAMVQKLEEENKQLLTKVGSKGGRTRARGGAAPEGREDSLEADIVSFSDAEEGGEDDW